MSGRRAWVCGHDSPVALSLPDGSLILSCPLHSVDHRKVDGRENGKGNRGDGSVHKTLALQV